MLAGFQTTITGNKGQQDLVWYIILLSLHSDLFNLKICEWKELTVFALDTFNRYNIKEMGKWAFLTGK